MGGKCSPDDDDLPDVRVQSALYFPIRALEVHACLDPVQLRIDLCWGIASPEKDHDGHWPATQPCFVGVNESRPRLRQARSHDSVW